MIDEIKGMFTEKLVPTLVVLGAGVLVGVLLGCFTPVKRIFKRKKY